MVRLRFTPLDDPGDRPSTLTLTRSRDGPYTGTGANLRYDGRWGVAATVRATTVPVEPEVPSRIELPASTVTQENVDEFIDLGF